MIYFDDLPLNKEIMDALSKLEIDYVFQPIFHSDQKTVYAWEALMRPHGCTVTELIDEYTKRDELHTLEVATFFGAVQAYILRNYQEPVSINSFPSESFTEEETAAFNSYFGDWSGRGIVEILEYPYVSLKRWAQKKEVLELSRLQIALDDFGAGNNNMSAVSLFTPNIVKLDRSLISGIDSSPKKQENCKKYVEDFHANNIKVLAEGVETKEECEYLVSLGVDLLQGYYLGRPM